jgi:hypothetical protein
VVADRLVWSSYNGMGRCGFCCGEMSDELKFCLTGELSLFLLTSGQLVIWREFPITVYPCSEIVVLMWQIHVFTYLNIVENSRSVIAKIYIF